KLLPTGTQTSSLKGLFNLNLLNGLLKTDGQSLITVPAEFK
ncbi:MAG: hypothetical protein RJA30_212, partial [Actinomycetota bacterium]